MWRIRAEQEVNRTLMRGCRTWFGTLTPRPEVAATWQLLAAKYQADRVGTPFDALDDAERFKLRWRHMSREITLMIKRLRKEGHRFTFLCVSERFTGGGVYDAAGVPHAHMLLHELEVQSPIRHAALASAWPCGFSKWKLVEDPRQIGYVSKYLSKDARTRVRCSEHYGEGWDVLTTK